MKQRIITSIGILGVLGLVAYYHNPVMIWSLLGILYLLSIKEIVSFDKTTSIFFAYAFALTIWLLLPILDMKIEIIIILFGTILASLNAYNKRFVSSNDFKILLYPTIGFIYTYYLYDNFHMVYLGLLVVIVSMTDVGAYFVGKSIGKTKFSETSPNKTLEGVFGGIIVSTITASIYAYYLLETDIFLMMIIIFITAISSIFGDLYESKLKREANVKDSGNILPGHGGILDRVDGYIFAAPILTILLAI